MGKVLTRQVDPVSLLCIFTNLWKGSGIIFPPSAVKATELLLVALRLVLMSQRGQGVVLP